MRKLFSNRGLERIPVIFIFVITIGLSFIFTVHAQTITFAQFQEDDPSGNFVFANNTTNATFNTIPGGAPVSFRYRNISGLPTEITNFQSAHLIVTTTTSLPATLIGGNLTQQLNQTITISIIRDTPASSGTGGGSRTNLLTTVITTDLSSPNISGSLNGSSASFLGSTPAQSVIFTSDFISFAATTERNAGFSFSGLDPSLSMGVGGFLNSFTTDATGTFASDPVPTYAPPTAASVEIGGRILNESNSGIRGAKVTLTEANGTQHTMTTGSFGRYRFFGIEVGQPVVITVSSGRYSFSQRVINLEDNISDLNFNPDL